jgi:hypothetical protein
MRPGHEEANRCLASPLLLCSVPFLHRLTITFIPYVCFEYWMRAYFSPNDVLIPLPALDSYTLVLKATLCHRKVEMWQGKYDKERTKVLSMAEENKLYGLHFLSVVDCMLPVDFPCLSPLPHIYMTADTHTHTHTHSVVSENKMMLSLKAAQVIHTTIFFSPMCAGITPPPPASPLYTI